MWIVEYRCSPYVLLMPVAYYYVIISVCYQTYQELGHFLTVKKWERKKKQVDRLRQEEK